VGKRCFENMARLIKQKRVGHPKSYSQSELSNLLGYKNGQFISNVERSLCSIPLKMLTKVSAILDIGHEEIKTAMLRDQEQTIINFMKPTTAISASHDVKSDLPIDARKESAE